jgi:hypothetical protein
MPLMRKSLLVLVASVLAVAALSPRATLAQQPAPSRIVAIGDIHGAGAQFAEVLTAAGLADAEGRWTGANATFVQTGDYFDRGADVRRILDLLMRLDDQARRAGGRADVLMGNHEAMNILHDFDDVSPAVFASFADAKSEERRRKAFDEYMNIVKRAPASTFAPQTRDEWMTAHPAGYLEYVDALAPRGTYGRWMRARKVVVQIDGTIFMHAGISPESRLGVEDVNREVARTLRDWDAAVDMMVGARLIRPFFTLKETIAAAAAELQRIATAIKANEPLDERVTREYVDRLQAVTQIGTSPVLAADGPMWYRGLSEAATTLTDDQVAVLLQRLNATRFVIGHTPQLPGRVTPRFGNRVFAIDTGMLTTFFKGGRPSALELQGPQVTAIYANERVALTTR